MVFVTQHLRVLRTTLDHRLRWPGAKAPAEWCRENTLEKTPAAIERLSREHSREELRALCMNPQISPDIAYLCVMAWGGQRPVNAREAWRARDKIAEQISKLRGSHPSPEDAYSLFTGSGSIPRLGVAYFTKILFFCSGSTDHYILDQWTAKSMNLLCGHKLIPVLQNHVPRHTTPEQYARYCELTDQLALELGVSGARAEELMFSQGGKTNRGAWRRYVMEHSGP